MDEYLTPKKAAEIKGVSVPTIYKAIERGLLPSVRVLDRIALRSADLDAYQPGSYNGIKRTIKPRGPGRGQSRGVATLQETSPAATAVAGERTDSRTVLAARAFPEAVAAAGIKVKGPQGGSG